MAKNREPENPVDESESESESGEESAAASSEEIGSGDSDSEPELTQVPKKPPPSAPATLKKHQPQQPPPSSSSEEESGSESEPDSDEPIKNVKPIATKAMAELQKSSGGAKRPAGSKTDAPELVTPAKDGKRTAEEEEKKKKADPENSEKKPGVDDSKKLFQRIWSEEDEILVLKGMISYAGKKKLDPVADLNAFHDYIKKNLHFEATTNQLQDKIRRLRKKYENNKKKGNKTLAKPHEQKAYELSEKIWGAENGKEKGGEKLVLGSPKAEGGGTARKATNKKAIVVNGDEVKDASNSGVVDGGLEYLLPAKRSSYGDGSVQETVSRIGNELFESGKRPEEAKEWKRLKVTMIELHMKQLEVEAAQAKLVLNGLKSADN